MYPKNIRFRESEKSRVFIKVTKTKVLASFGQIIEVLFSQGKFPLGVSPTSVPEDIAEKAHLDPQQAQQWLMMYSTAMERCEQNDKQDSYGGAPVVQRTDVSTDLSFYRRK